MKITLNWLKEYVAFDWSAEQLAEQLTMLGLEVEGMRKLGSEFEGIVVAQIKTSEQHPNADRLSVCRVDDGKGERQIVCGAKNYKLGDKVPLIQAGHSLPAKPGQPPVTIKAGKIRGVESQGMLCSPQELGLASDVDGLLILPANAQVGQPFAEHLGRAAADVAFDLEITPNRPDWNSVIGIAREISAITGHPLRLPQLGEPATASSSAELDSLVKVRIDDPERCPRYVARLIRGVKVGPSPDWLRQRLESIGLRSISNVVDVTNFVMLEIGQPLHAFDYHLLAPQPGQSQPTIVVRGAKPGEEFVTLDGEKRVLTYSMLLIADDTKPIALAGIMGGRNTEINERTVDVLLESAYFKPQNIRATSKQLGLRSESSYRFERGADLGITDWASRRAAQLILQTAGGKLVEGVADVFPAPKPVRAITLRYQRTNALLGASIAPSVQRSFLGQLGLRETQGDDSATRFEIPSFRVDLKVEADLIEEVGRLHGVNNIVSTPPRGAIGSNAVDSVHDAILDARRLLAGLGLFEAQGQTLISDRVATPFASPDTIVALDNPLSSDMNVLRPSLLPGLLEALRRNLHHKTSDVALFEIGRVFNRAGATAREERRVALVLTGHRHDATWSGGERGAKFDLYDLKGCVEEFLEQYGLRGVTYQKNSNPEASSLESASVRLGKLELGQIGQLHPAIAKEYDQRDAVLYAEINLDQLIARRTKDRSFSSLPTFPSVRRDLAMLLPESATHENVLAAVKQSQPQFIEQVEVFDIFRGASVPPGQKSVAYAFTYRHPERTLTDAEVNAAQEKLTEGLKQRLGAVIRA